MTFQVDLTKSESNTSSILILSFEHRNPKVGYITNLVGQMSRMGYDTTQDEQGNILAWENGKLMAFILDADNICLENINLLAKMPQIQFNFIVDESNEDKVNEIISTCKDVNEVEDGFIIKNINIVRNDS